MENHILIVDDEEVIRRSFKSVLSGFKDYIIDEAVDGLDCIEKVTKKKYDIIFLDISMKRMDGLEALDRLVLMNSEASIIMMSGNGTIEVAVECVKKGAFDYLQKPLDINRIIITIENALDRSKLMKEKKVLTRKIQRSKVQEIVGESDAIKKVKEQIDLAAPYDNAGVLITGENGSGKELVARWIHAKSVRSHKELIEVNCAAMSEELIDSTLFGSVKGAYTSSIRDQKGKFALADGGTLFLDEVGDMSMNAQAKILRALQEKIITPVGAEKDTKVDVRVIAATNKNLKEEIARGRFRLDLFNRLEMVPIHVPPLNNRREDIPALVDHFSAKFCEENSIPEKTFTTDALVALKNMDWSGNVRQLQNVVIRLIIFTATKQIIDVTDVRTHIIPVQDTHKYAELFFRYENIEDLLRYVASEYTRFTGRTVL